MKRVLVLCLALMIAVPLVAQVKVTQADDRIVVDVDGKPFTELVMKGDGVLKPYYYPIYSASGKVITRHYPMKKVEGESDDHPHHRGLWFAHGDVNGLDYWSADPSREGDKYGKIELRSVGKVKSGKGEGSFQTVFDWKDSAGDVLVTEERVTTVYSTGLPLRIMDVDITLLGVKKAKFGDTKEGTFAIRLQDSMNERNTGTLVNAQGEEGEKQVWGKASPFMDYYGEVDGEVLGVAFFDHPGNPKHPTYWHVRGYGLFAANVFGEHDFFKDESRDGSITLEPGDTMRFRYRVLIHSGDPDSANINKHYAGWAGGRYMATFQKSGKCVLKGK